MEQLKYSKSTIFAMGYGKLMPNRRDTHVEVLPLTIIIILFFLFPSAHSIYFNFPKFEPNNPTEVNYSSGVSASGGVIDLTKDEGGYSQNLAIGRAIYKNRIQIWDSQTRNLTDFKAQFSFIIDGRSQSDPRDGFTFFLSPDVSTNTLPYSVSGRNLGIYSDSNASDPKNQLVAIEFDTYPNDWDPSLPHVGININSRVSKITCDLWINSTNKVSKGNASVSYFASTKNLSVFLSYDQNPGFGVVPDLHYTVDLREILPEWVYVGFSATSGGLEVELHQIRSWEFNSNLETSQTGNGEVNSSVPKKDDRKKTGLIAGMVVGGAVLCAGLGGLVLFGLKMKRNRSRKEERIRSRKEEGVAFEVEMNDEFERGTGPKRFSYSELVLATRDFSEDGKLGEGGSGGVYRGFLDEMNLDVAVKRVSRDSKQGKKEYVSEVKIISRLRHRNLVQLLGWCHERDELLLIYELMPNGSLDFHLFHEKKLLRWALRYKIATGLASALLYLHEEWEQCVVHRDIKSSNVMLDSNFNAKLGDFGLARLVDHEHGLQTTVIAGTRGYLAPECVTTGTTGKASKESDVYSFGVVALEIACGRRPVEPKAEAGKVMMVEWVWELYGKGLLLDAADEKLGKEFDVEQMEKLMILGLWCAHPDHNSRPSIRQVIGVLNLEAPLPSLPSKMPVPMYFAPPMYNIPPETVYSNPPSITSVGSGR
ncbi:L-type lectin-domain-containing protein [Cinnamomum micranthum f. kanehirae]|uniref:L-type lectin-domain-containing protein n=1 Tax=Cinnamomum micranthum f. kanehirae TaxID=337451 RepID=A0A3S3Q169_9MAGN|nr:L-type lectin-domain-containing protein [Cinnamomum micranthum f. kanehirae]